MAPHPEDSNAQGYQEASASQSGGPSEGHSSPTAAEEGSSDGGIGASTAAAAPQTDGSTYDPSTQADEEVTGSRLTEYRKDLVAAEQKSQDAFDKAVLTLSGGALGVSFAFVKDIVGPGSVAHPWLLLAAWIAWGFSLVACLASFWFGQQALLTAIGQVDNGTIDVERAGRGFARTTVVLNAAGGILFILGVILLVPFVGSNLERTPASSHTALGDPEVRLAASIGPFADADTALSEADWRSAESSLLGAIHAARTQGAVDGILLLGGVDRRALSQDARRRYASNRALAQARANNVRARLRAKLADSIPISLIPQGALELDDRERAAQFGRDRRVDVYLIVRAPGGTRTP